jgi:hypothetical protein
MKVMELALLPSTFGENVMRRDTCLFIGHVIVQEDRMLDGHWPQTSIGDIGPMNRRMEHHGSGDSHDGLNVPFINCIVMVSSSISKSNDLHKLRKLGSELFRGEGGSVVGQEGLCDDARVSRHQLVLLLSFQSFMGHQMRLKFDVHVARSMIHKNASATAHVVWIALPATSEQSAFC